MYVGHMDEDASPVPTPRVAGNIGAPSVQLQNQAGMWMARDTPSRQKKHSISGHKRLSFNMHPHHHHHHEQIGFGVEPHAHHISGKDRAKDQSMHESHSNEGGPVLFSPITELAVINEEKAKNRVAIGLAPDSHFSPLNVSVTSVLDVSHTGRRQRSVCVKNVKQLVRN